MSKRSSTQSFLLSLGVKRIRCGENSSEEQPESALEPADHTNDTHDDDNEGQYNPDEDALDEITECSSKADRGGPNQPKSSQILATTKRIHPIKHDMYKQDGLANIPGSLIMRQERSFFVITALLLRRN